MELLRHEIGTFETSPKLLKLRELAQKYHQITEQFDRMHTSSSSERDQCSMSANRAQLIQVSINARRVFKQLCLEGSEWMITPAELRQEIRNYNPAMLKRTL